MNVLGIETSCDETAAAVVDDGRHVLSNVVLSQTEAHAPFGGIVPEVAARAHLDYVDSVVERAMREAGLDWDDLDAVAATAGPGLIGGVLVGVMTGKAIAAARGLPFVAVNHLEGHALTVRLTDDAAFPYLLLLVSGGHCQLLEVAGIGVYRRLGTTIDDALGEAFDKTAKLMGLPYPGGPEIERWAAEGDPARFEMPRPMKGREGCDFSFSGLKTKVRQTVEALPPGRLSDRDLADVAAAFQQAAFEAVADRVDHAAEDFRARHPEATTLVVAGGVAANRTLRTLLQDVAGAHGLALLAPPPKLCTDNGAMIAWAGLERFRLGLTSPLDFKPRPRWPLDPDAPKRAFAGVKA